MSSRDKPDRPIYCGNFEYDADVREIERLFDRYGDVEHVDMKAGFAFVYMKYKRDGEDAIRALDRREFGYKRRRLIVEWSKSAGQFQATTQKRRENARPTTTLFVVNFDQRTTRERDVERLFEVYGRLQRVQIKRSYAFVEFKNIDDAMDAFNRTQNIELHGKRLTVEYASTEDYTVRRNERDRSRSPSARRGRISRSLTPPRRGSPSPVRRRSPSPRRRRDSPSRSPVASPRNGRHAGSPPPRSRTRSRSRSASPRNGDRARSMSTGSRDRQQDEQRRSESPGQ